MAHGSASWARTAVIVTLSGACMMGGLVLPRSALALELNQATEAELDSLKGMGPALNRRVRAARTEQVFRDWADLQQRVSGIGAAKARAFSEQGLTVQGQAFTP
jgi:competence protein ComEA